jgi:hypothetical protein
MKTAFVPLVVIFSCAALLLTQSAQAMPELSRAYSVSSLQQQAPAAAPIPSDLLQAKKVYLQDKSSSPALYAQFSAAMNTWGYYTFVDSPAQADVVFDFQDQPLSVVVVQPSTQVVLWTIAARPDIPIQRTPAQTAALQMQSLVSSIKQLNGAPLTPQETASITPPPQSKHGTLVAVIIIAGSLAIAGVVVALLHGRGHK